MKAGDRVVCVDASGYNGRLNSPPLKKGKVYMVYSTRACLCGAVALDVGITRPNVGIGLHHCCKCGNTTDPTEWFVRSSRFRKMEEKPFTNTLTKQLAEKAKRGVQTIEIEELTIEKV